MNFINIGTLGGALGLGAAAAAVPLIIHILNRRRFRVIEWAAMKFLLDAQRENRRRVLLEQLILLLLRMLLAAILVWIILRPLLPSEGAGNLLGGSTDHVFVVDDSRSMGAVSAGTPLVDRARNLLLDYADVLEERGGTDTLTVLRTSRPEQPDLLRVPAASELARDQLAAFSSMLAPTDGRADLARALAAAADLAEGSEGAGVVVTVLGDGCLADYRDSTSGGSRPDLVEAAGRVTASGKLRVVDLAARGSRENLAVTDVSLVEGNVMATAPVTLRVQVTNFGARAARDVVVSISSSSITRALPAIDEIAPGGDATIDVPFAFSKAGSELVRASLPGGDRFPADDAGVLAVDVLEALDVLVVDGEGGESVDAGDLEGDVARGAESYFLRRALAPLGNVRSGLSVEVASEDRFAGIALDGYAAVVLANVFRVPPEQVDALYDFVSDGGGLLLFPGDQTDAEVFARDLYRDGDGLSPARIGTLHGDPVGDEFASFAAPPGAHPVTSLFAGDDNPFLAPVKLYAWYALEPAGDAETLLKTGAGRGGVVEGVGVPVLVERSVGKGRVLLFGVPADDEWTNWPGEPSYLVTIQEAVNHVAPRRSSTNNVAIGTEIVLPIDPARFEVTARLKTPADAKGDVRELTLTAGKVDDEPLAFDLGRLDRAGAYTLHLQRRGGGERLVHYAVAAAAAEGDQRRADATAIANLLPDVELELLEDPAQLLAADDEAERAELWRLLTYLALAAALLETLLAWRFGHYSGGNLTGGAS